MREFFKNLPDTTTPLNAQRMNGFLNGNEAMGSIVVDDISCKNKLNLASRTIGLKTNGTSTAEAFEDLSTNNEIKIKPLVVATFFSHQIVIENLKPNTDYTLSSSFTGTWQVHIYNDKLYGNSIFSQPLRRSNTFNTGDNTRIVLGFYSYNNPINTTYSISNIMLEEGSTPTEYTPYKNFDNKSEQLTDFIKANAGFTILQQNIFKQGNHYFGNLVIKKDNGNFSNTNETVATMPIPGNVINSGCFLSNSQWQTTSIGYYYVSANSIIVSDFGGTTNNIAKINIDVVDMSTITATSEATIPLEEETTLL